MSDELTQSGLPPCEGIDAGANGDNGSPDNELSLRKRFFNVQTLVSFVAAFAILYFFMTRVDIDLGATWERIKGANPLYYVAALLAYYATFMLRAIRWRMLLNNVGMHKEDGACLPSIWGMLEIILISWFANCVVPAKLGDAYRAYLLKWRGRVSFSRTAGTIVAERVIDILVLFVLLAASALGLLGLRGGGAAIGIMEVGLGFVLVMVLGLVAIKVFGNQIHSWLPQRLQAFWTRFQDGTLRSFQQLPAVCFLSVVIWLGEALRLLFVTYSLDLPMSFAVVLFVALANSLLTAIPFTPGGLGLVEAGVVGLFLGLGILDKPDAVSVTLLDRTISYWSLVVVGLALYLVSTARSGRARQATRMAVAAGPSEREG